MEQLLKIFENLDLGLLMMGLVVLAVCLFVTRLIMRLINRVLAASSRIDASLHSMIRTLARIVLYFLSILLSAGTMGIPVTSFVALFSVIGLAVSLAVQGVLSNLAGGVIILASKPFTLGDYIESEAVSGTVTEIGFLHTRMVSPDGKMIFVPNNLLYNSKLINYTYAGTRRIDLMLRADYSNTPTQVREAALQAVSSIETILAEPAPEVLLENYGDSAVEYTLRVWTNAGDYLSSRYRLNEAIHAAFRENGVHMTYPHLNVHIAGDE